MASTWRNFKNIFSRPLHHHFYAGNARISPIFHFDRVNNGGIVHMLCINWKSFSTTFYKFEKHFSLSIWQYIQLVNVVFQDGGQFLQSFCTRYWALFSQAVILCQFLSFGSIWFILLWSTYYCNMGFSRNEFKIRKMFGQKSIIP